jgi:hypothetical protein
MGEQAQEAAGVWFFTFRLALGNWSQSTGFIALFSGKNEAHTESMVYKPTTQLSRNALALALLGLARKRGQNSVFDSFGEGVGPLAYRLRRDTNGSGCEGGRAAQLFDRLVFCHSDIKAFFTFSRQGDGLNKF